MKRFLAASMLVSMGGFSLAAQTLLFREYIAASRGNELSIAAFFSTWLVWIAVGASIASLVTRGQRASALFLPLVTLYPLLVVGQLLLIVNLRWLAGVAPAEAFGLGQLLVGTLLVNLPVSLLTGLLFPLACVFAARQMAVTREATAVVPRLYAYEALGSFAGGMAMTCLLWLGVPSLILLASASVAMALMTVVVARQIRSRLVCGAATLVALVAVAGGVASGSVDGDMGLGAMRWRGTLAGATRIESVETPYQRVSVASLPGQTVFVANGEVVASTADTPRQCATAALLVAEHPGLRRALVVGFGSEALVPELLHYGLTRVDLVMTDAALHDVCHPYWPDEVRAALADPRVHLHFVDPRDFVSDARERWDLVLVEMPRPDTARLNRLFTVDFYRDVSAILSRGGLFATVIPAGENYAGADLATLGRSVTHSLAQVFPYVRRTPGERSWVFASEDPARVSLDASVLSARLGALAVRDMSVPPKIFESLVPPERVAATKVAGGLEAPILNTDARPVTLFLALLNAAAQGGGELGRPLASLQRIGVVVFLLPIVIALAVRLAFRVTARGGLDAGPFNATALLAVTGALAMCVDLVLLVGFQNRFGDVFLEVGLLAALFMLGLGLGGLAGSALLGGVAPGKLWPVHGLSASLGTFLVSLPTAIRWLGAAGQSVALWGYLIMFLAAGLLSGLAFPVAGHAMARANAGTGWLAALFDTADHWGGAVGAALVGVLALPILGLRATCLLLVAMLGAAWALFAFEWLLLHSDGMGGWFRARYGGPTRAERTRPLWFALGGVVASVVVVSGLVDRELAAPRIDLDQERLAVRTRAVGVSPVAEPFLHYELHTGSTEDPPRVALASMAVAPDVEGYGGPMNLLVMVRLEEPPVFDEIAVITSNETPAYVHGLGQWLGGFEGRPLTEPVTLGARGVDAMSGATVTSRAVADIVEQTRLAVGHDLLGRADVSAPETPTSGTVDWALVYVVIALPLAVVVYFRGGEGLRVGFLLVNLVLGGFLLNLQVSLRSLVQLLGGHLPSWHAPSVFALVVGVSLLTVVFGPIYCGTLCPFGAAQELLGRLRLLSTGGTWSIGTSTLARRVRIWVLVVVLLGVFGLHSGALLSLDPLETAFAWRSSVSMAVLMGLVAVASLFVFRFWCRFLCPVGAFLGLFNRLGLPFRWTRPRMISRCTLGAQNRSSLDCLQCGGCAAPAGSQASPPGDGRWKLWTAVAAALGVMVWLVAAGGPMTPRSVETLSGARTTDVQAVHRQIDDGRLSDHEALFYGVITEPR